MINLPENIQFYFYLYLHLQEKKFCLILVSKDSECSCSQNTKPMNPSVRDTATDTQHFLQPRLALALL